MHCCLQPSQSPDSRFQIFQGKLGSLALKGSDQDAVTFQIGHLRKEIVILFQIFPSTHPSTLSGSSPRSGDKGCQLPENLFMPLDAGFHTHCQSSGRLPAEAGVMSAALA